MKKLRFFLLSIAAVLFILPASFAQNKADDVVGVWLNQDEDAHIEITNKDGKYYGKIIWLKFPIDDETGKPKVDKHNPDESLRKRPSLGLEILKDFEFDGDETWRDGEIYNPKKGKTYNCYMRFIEKDKLKIRGFIGVSLIGKTNIWTRVEK